MSVILLRLPELRTKTSGRPNQCPYCDSQILQRWGRVKKQVKDMCDVVAVIYRYKCLDCGRTFRDYPDDIDRSDHGRNIRRLAAVLWALGFSYREIIRIFDERKIKLSRSTIWREGQEVYSQLSGRRIEKLRQDYQIDKTYIHKVSSKLGLVLAIDLRNDKYIILGTLNEYNPSFVTTWLRPLLKDTNIEVTHFGTDSLDRIYAPN
jgi:DNA-directed RNA polymerase subunit RPC12/RpoP